MIARALAAVVLLLLSHVTAADSAIRVHPLYLQGSYRHDQTWSTLRDQSGFLWLATDDGLRRYDGYEFKTLTHNPNDPSSLASKSIRTLHQSRDGTLWVAGNMLHRYHPATETFTRFLVNDYKFIYTIFETADGALWLGGDGFGLLRFDPVAGEISHRLLTDGKEGSSVYRIRESGQDGILWLATDKGLLAFDHQTLTTETVYTPPKPSSTRVFGMEEDQQGKVWLATQKGLFIVDPAARSAQHLQATLDDPAAIPTNMLSSLARDRHGNIWIGTDKHGVYLRKPNSQTFQHFPASANDAYRFPLARINHIQEDDEGNLWFSASAHGVYRISAHIQKFSSFQHSFDTDNSLTFNNVLALHEDKSGYIWIATDGGGLDRFDPRTYDFLHFRHDPGNSNSLSSDTILDIAEDSRGRLWLGTWAAGLNQLDPETGSVKRFFYDPDAAQGKTLAGNSIARLIVDKDDRLIMAIDGVGLQIYDSVANTFNTFSAGGSSGILNNYINDIALTPKGDYWVGGYQGLEFYSAQTGTFSAPDIELSQHVFDLHLGDDGLLWMATDNGLLHYNDKTNEVARFTTRDGLPDNHILGIQQDSLGFMWLSTRDGLARFAPGNKDVEVFHAKDGLAGNQFNRRSHLQTRDGLLYFGSTSGFSAFNPRYIPKNEYAPQIHITDIAVNNVPQQAPNSPYVTQSIDLVESVVLPSTADRISINFTATDLISPGQNQYRYRLLGLHEDWQSVGSDVRAVQYNNLPAGEYTLQIVASNNDGVWAGSAKELRLTILPDWWQTYWAYGFYLVMFTGIVYGFSVFRLKHNIQQRRKLELLVHEQTAKLLTASRAIQQLNAQLEQRVAQRTHDLSMEIEERKESESKVTYIAYHDSLTGLYNRAWLLRHLEGLLQRDLKQGVRFAVLFIGGDRFRKINDTNGHETGDKLLIATGQRLKAICGTSAQIARLGSDEFVAVIDDMTSRNQIITLVETVVEELKKPLIIDRLRILFSVSVGFLIADNSYSDPALVLRDASIAMQRAKERGRGLSQEFDQEILQQTVDLAAIEADLKVALSRKEFSVVYQPIILLTTGKIVGFEVLLRWQHPERGPIPPDRFIPMAEASGLICDIGLWVLEQACQQLQLWHGVSFGVDKPFIAVNLSPVQLQRTDFLERLDEIFRFTGVSPQQIEFEITESALITHTDVVDGVLEALKNRGIKLAIDDFGTGYSSLSYLDQLPVQVLKIDRSFVNSLTSGSQKNGHTGEIVRSTITLAHNLGMRIVAEGIETQQQLSMLQSYGCDYGQGYLFARPMPPDQATAALEESINS